MRALLALLAASALQATPAPELRATVDALPEAELDRILQTLKERYVEPGALDATEQKRATVQGLLARLGTGATLRAAPATEPAPEPAAFRAETLDGRAGYVRLGTLRAESLPELDKALDGFRTAKLPAVIVDLRATPPTTAWDQAAEVCRRFVTKGRALWTLREPRTEREELFTTREDPRFTGLLAVLTDEDTAGAPELVAAALRTHAQALVLGARTRGEAAEYAETPLAGGGVLRVATAEATLPGAGAESIFPKGVAPDVTVDVSPETTQAVLKQGLEAGAASLVLETERPRMNEAALVAGQNPELDAAQAMQRLRGERPKAQLKDAVLQRALDYVTAVGIWEKGRGR